MYFDDDIPEVDVSEIRMTVLPAIDIPEDLMDWLNWRAAKLDISCATLVNDLLEEGRTKSPRVWFD